MTVDCIGKEKRRFLNTGKQIEKDKDEYGISRMSWYVYIMNIYLIVLFQTICKRVLEKVNEEVELLQEDEISFQLVMESVEEAIVLGDNIVAKGIIEHFEERNNQLVIMQQWKRLLEALNTLIQMDDNNFDNLICEENILRKVYNIIQQRNKLDEDIK